MTGLPKPKVLFLPLLLLLPLLVADPCSFWRSGLSPGNVNQQLHQDIWAHRGPGIPLSHEWPFYSESQVSLLPQLHAAWGVCSPRSGLKMPF